MHATYASLCKGPIFYYYVFSFIQRVKVFLLFLLFFSFGKHHVVRKDLGTYVQLNMGGMSYYCWHHPWGEYVGRRNYKPLSFYVSVWNVLLIGMRWLLAIIEDYMMVEYVDLLKRPRHVTLPEKIMNCSCKVDWEHSLLVSNRVFALYFDYVMNCYLFMGSIWCKFYNKSFMLNFIVVIIIYMMHLCRYFVFIDASLSKHVDMFFDFVFHLRTSEV